MWRRVFFKTDEIEYNVTKGQWAKQERLSWIGAGKGG